MKLSLEALKERSEAVASTELLATISGGVENACHDSEPKPASDVEQVIGFYEFWYHMIKYATGNGW